MLVILHVITICMDCYLVLHRCNSGWTGKACDQCVKMAGCVNGDCNGKPNSCYCNEGWQGVLCNEPICAQGCNLTNAMCSYVSGHTLHSKTTSMISYSAW